MARKAMKLVDRSSHPLPAQPKGLLYWSTAKISASLTNNVHVDPKLIHRSFGRDVLGTSSFKTSDGTPVTSEHAAPADIVVQSCGCNGKDACDHSAELMIRASQRRTVPNPDATPDPEMPGTGNGSIARFASHSANGEDASTSASLQGAITAEPVNARRIAVDAYIQAHPGVSYRQAWNAVQIAQDADTARRAAKTARNRRRRASK